MHGRTVARALMQCEYRNIALESRPEFGVIGQAYDYVTKPFRRNAVDEVYEPVFQTSDIQTKYDVRNKRWRFIASCRLETRRDDAPVIGAGPHCFLTQATSR